MPKKEEPEYVLYDRAPADGEALPSSEVLRLLLHATQTPFHFVTCEEGSVEQMREAGRLPFDDLPALCVREGRGDGFAVAPLESCVRFVARKHGLDGDSLKDQRLCDSVASGAFAVVDGLRQARLLTAEAVAAHNAACSAIRSRQQQLLSGQHAAVLPTPTDHLAAFVETLPRRLAALDRLLHQNATEGPFFCGKGLTWTYCDLCVFDACVRAQTLAPKCLEQHPKLEKHYEAVGRMQDLKAHLAERSDKLAAP
eukprot:Hpha_TRINITY_DN34069_c0_g1::TRINITY_DN34069_c0_g1_i1::g.30622::m.30622